MILPFHNDFPGKTAIFTFIRAEPPNPLRSKVGLLLDREVSK
jgi:hypothetical protein